MSEGRSADGCPGAGEHGIDVIPFKGSILAKVVYGDLALYAATKEFPGHERSGDESDTQSLCGHPGKHRRGLWPG